MQYRGKETVMHLSQLLKQIPATYRPLLARWPMGRKLTLFLVCALVAWATAWGLPALDGAGPLSEEARKTLFILVLAIGLWVTEAVPAFAVSLLVVGYQIFAIGRGADADSGAALEKYTRAWSSPVIWIMLGGFFLSMALARAPVVRAVCVRVVALGQGHSLRLLFILMAITAVLSMFISNTASTSLMIGLLLPLLSRMASAPSEVRAFLVAIPAAASIGGMGTIVGSTPNALAYAYLHNAGTGITFIRWTAIALPMAFLFLVAIWAFTAWTFRPLPKLDLSLLLLKPQHPPSEATRDLSRLEQGIALGTFFLTVFLWTFSSVYQVSVAEASFIPILLLTVTGIIRPTDIRELPWDTLLLVMGGLSLGQSIAESGLANQVAQALRTGGDFPLVEILVFAYLSALFSNFMSNTAAAAILIPLGNEVMPGHTLKVTLIIALAASAATMLPVSTPPNAIAASTGYVRTVDFLRVGAFLLLLAPLCLTLFVWAVG